MAATLKTRLPMIAAELRPRVSAAVKESAERIALGAQENLLTGDHPYATGELADSIHVQRVGSGEYAVVAGEHDSFYGHMVEFGTQASPKRPFSTAPRPFLMPAAEAEIPLAIARVTAVLRGL